ncbi:MAG TPA: NUDIX hydrolase [Pirellulales bacterium]|nr:NUDIX hydrolase [Pirellulales bacterium]
MHEPELLLKTRRFDVVRLHYQAADGTVYTREVARHPGAVTILPLFDDGRVCLIRNYRVAVDQTLIELPAGTLEPGEDPAVAAARELEEETGYRAAEVRQLCEFFMSPGVLSERMYLFQATGLTAGPTRLEGGEQIEPFVVSWQEAMALVERGEIRDSKTLVGLLWFDRFGQTNPSSR